MKIKITVIILISFLSGCDVRYTRGADPIKNGNGYCLWFKDKSNNRHCAFSESIPPKSGLIYQDCFTQEDYERICQKI